MADDPLRDLDWTLELSYDIWEYPEHSTWCFGCLPCGVLLECGSKQTAESIKKGHRCRDLS